MDGIPSLAGPPAKICLIGISAPCKSKPFLFCATSRAQDVLKRGYVE
jgi:hypothetical protein